MEYPFFCFPMNLVLALVYPRLSENKTLFSCPCFEEYQKCVGTRRMQERRPQTIIGITKDIERKDILYHPQDMRFFGVRHREPKLVIGKNTFDIILMPLHAIHIWYIHFPQTIIPPGGYFTERDRGGMFRRRSVFTKIHFFCPFHSV